MDSKATLPIKATPYRHQIEAYTFALKRLMEGGGAALLMEMGTGKTLTAIAIVGALLLLAGIQRVLIVAPLSIVGVWRDEFERFAGFEYDLAVLEGSVAKKADTLRHLTGKRLQVAVINTIIANAGLKPEDIELVNVGFDLTTSLTTKSTDLVVGPFINDEIVTMKNAGYDVDVWKYQDYGVPQMYGLVMVANSEAYDADPETYQGFLRACAKGFDDMQKDEDQALEVIMSDMNSADNPLDEVQQKESYEILMPLMEQDGKPFLSMSEETWQAAMDWMFDSGLIKEKCEVSDLYRMPDSEILK